MQLRTNSAYIQAANNNNSFQMYTLAKAAHTRATSFAVAQHSFLQLLSLKMTSSFAEYVDRLLAQKDSFIAIFDPDGIGMMAIDNIITMILVNGLPDEFKYMKDLMFSKDLIGKFPDFKETLQAMMTKGRCPSHRRGSFRPNHHVRSYNRTNRLRSSQMWPMLKDVQQGPLLCLFRQG